MSCCPCRWARCSNSSIFKRYALHRWRPNHVHVRPVLEEKAAKTSGTCVSFKLTVALSCRA